ESPDNTAPPTRRTATHRDGSDRNSACRCGRGARAASCRKARGPARPGRASAFREIKLERGAINLGERGEIGDRRALIDLVHGQPDKAKLGDRAVMMDEARIGGAAGGA